MKELQLSGRVGWMSTYTSQLVMCEKGDNSGPHPGALSKESAASLWWGVLLLRPSQSRTMLRSTKQQTFPPRSAAFSLCSTMRRERTKERVYTMWCCGAWSHFKTNQKLGNPLKWTFTFLVELQVFPGWEDYCWFAESICWSRWHFKWF